MEPQKAEASKTPAGGFLVPLSSREGRVSLNSSRHRAKGESETTIKALVALRKGCSYRSDAWALLLGEQVHAQARTFLAASAMGIVDPYPGKCATFGVIQGDSAIQFFSSTRSTKHVSAAQSSATEYLRPSFEHVRPGPCYSRDGRASRFTKAVPRCAAPSLLRR